MYVSLLYEKAEGFSPNARYFLIKYLYQYGYEGEVRAGIKQLSKELGVNDRMVTQSIDFLSRNGYLTQSRLTGEGRGRPKKEIGIGKKLQEIIDKWAQQGREVVNADLIERLLQNWSVELSGAGCEGRLNNSTRLLLVVFWAHANCLGVLEGVGASELVALTGLGKSQIRGSIKRLMDAGYITSYSAGAAVKGEVGRKKSIYKLSFKTIDSQQIIQTRSLIVRSYALVVLNVAVQYACSSSSLSEEDLIKIESKYMDDGCLFSDVYPSRDDFIRCVSGATGFHWDVKGIFNLLCEVVCSLVAKMIVSGSPGQALESVSNSINDQMQASSFCGISIPQRIYIICILSWVAFALYKDVRPFLKVRGEEGRGIAECSIKFDTDEEVTLLNVKLKKTLSADK